MGPQMNTILLLLIFTGLVGMLLVVFFMLDRVNEIHKHSDIPQRGHVDPAAIFGGLTGKNLWDAMIGVPMPGWDQKRLATIRPRYDLVLQKHLELIFEDGKLDGREGYAMPVRCDRMVPTLRGEIESWIPHEFASGIYRAGYAIATTPEDGHEPIRQQIDMVGDALYAAAGLPPHPLSAILMPHLDRPKRPGEDEANEEEQTAEGEAGADGDASTEPTDALSGDAVAALPAPDAPDMLTPNLQAGEQPMPVEPVAELTAEEAPAPASADAAGEATAAVEATDEAVPPVVNGEPLEGAKAEPKVPA
jgi:hypothetical protein